MSFHWYTNIDWRSSRDFPGGENIFPNFVLVVFYLFQLWKLSANDDAHKNALEGQEKKSRKWIFFFKFTSVRRHIPLVSVSAGFLLGFSHILFLRTWGKQTLTAQLFSTRCFVLNWWALNRWDLFASLPSFVFYISHSAWLYCPILSSLACPIPSSSQQFIHNQQC